MVFFVILFILFPFLKGEKWAILLSGIGPWEIFSYSSEADVYQSYYQLINGGLDPDHIIVFAMNTTAYASQNPHKGEVYSYPGGPNVYPFIDGHIDYVFEDNTPENFIKVLLGEDMTGIGSGKTLQSTEEDEVLILSTQHGDLGYIVWYYNSTSERKILFADELVSTIETMQKKKMFGKFFWNQCSCFSGSIWNKQLANTENIHIVTAASPDREGNICNYDEELKMPTSCCLMKRLLELARTADLTQTTLYDTYLYQYEGKTTTPLFVEEYCSYGDDQMAKKTMLSDFFGTNHKQLLRQQQSDNKEQQEKMIRISMKNGNKIMSTTKKNYSNRKKQQTGTIFDVDIEFCDMFPSFNQTCVKEIVKKVIPYDPFETCLWQTFDFLRISCSVEHADVETISNQIIYACEHPTPTDTANTRKTTTTQRRR